MLDITFSTQMQKYVMTDKINIEKNIAKVKCFLRIIFKNGDILCISQFFTIFLQNFMEFYQFTGEFCLFSLTDLPHNKRLRNFSCCVIMFCIYCGVIGCAYFRN